MPKLSIIVPIYNTEQYLEKCLFSLVNQTLQEIEILLINDGSTDDSQSIINKYVKKYPLICKGYYKSNSGQAAARNLGIEHASGEFIAFVDSDDYVKLDAYEKAYNYAIKNNLDVVCFDFLQESQNGRKPSNYYQFKQCNADIKYILNETSSVNKIIRRDLINRNNIRFIENYIYEDLEFIPKLILYTNKIGFLDEPLYYYVIHENSTMRQQKYNNKLGNIYFVMESLKNTFANSKYDNELEYLFIEHLLHAAVLRYLDYSEGSKNIEKISNIMKENFPKWRKNKYYKMRNIKYKIVCTLAYYKRIKLLKILLKK